jgi:molybdenum cofactor guanylyltransferase
MKQTTNCTGIILSGGLNTRMGGQNKAFIKLGEKRFLDRILDTLKTCCSHYLIVTREPELYTEWQIESTTDIFDIRSPLTGIHAGLSAMQTNFAFVTSCDTPLLKKEVLEILVKAIVPGVDVIVPASGTYYQPMCAIYSKRCAVIIEQMLNSHELKVDRLYERVQLKPIPYERFEAVDPQLLSFFNINTTDDLKMAQELYDSLKSNC